MTHSGDPYQACATRSSGDFLGGTAALSMATQIQTLAMGWQVFQITRDPLSLGLIGLAEAVPFLSLALVGGHAADRMDRRRLSLLALGRPAAGRRAAPGPEPGPAPPGRLALLPDPGPFGSGPGLLPARLPGPEHRAGAPGGVPERRHWRSSSMQLAMVRARPWAG